MLLRLKFATRGNHFNQNPYHGTVSFNLFFFKRTINLPENFKISYDTSHFNVWVNILFVFSESKICFIFFRNFYISVTTLSSQ